jgi:hypothetical protein
VIGFPISPPLLGLGTVGRTSDFPHPIEMLVIPHRDRESEVVREALPVVWRELSAKV